ncbi:hypothetical protein [Rhizobium sp. PP-F2F-G48]|uniref:hypothetical protein n=1 Tax=Rhizobium sp. PP-F2F-G48 TaxID=2135651 RepID=UPI0010497BF6|nr:hypothetical protein [Rhizobium sp. PP-F2F-G48]
MAHFGVGEGLYGERWTKESAVLVFQNDNVFVKNVWTRANYLAQLTFHLEDLCEAALKTVVSKADERHKVLFYTLMKLVREDEEIVRLLYKHMFNPENFFGDAESAAEFWEVDGMREVFTPMFVSTDFEATCGPKVVSKL